jgi:selenide,water dikinase
MLDNNKYQEAIEIMSSINVPGKWLGEYPDVHAITDVTGFGLLGHILEICKESEVSMKVNLSNVPKLDTAIELIKDGILPSAAMHNLNDIESTVKFDTTVSLDERILLCDPQTNGGLLFTCTHSVVNDLIERLKNSGFCSTSIIGEVCAKDNENTIFIYK